MRSDQFHFVTRWRFQASAEAIFALLDRPLDFPRWWGSFFLHAALVEKGDEQGVDRLVRFQVKSPVPSELHWGYRTLNSIPGRRIDVRVSGDFAGDGLWLLEEDGIYTDVIFDWKVTPEKKLVKEFSGLCRPLFKTSHRLGMEQGRIGLEKELLKQGQAKREVILQQVPMLPAKAEATAEEKAKGHAAGR